MFFLFSAQLIAHSWPELSDESAESDCAEHNLEVGIALGYLPPERKQLGSGWCYAFVAADLLSHRLRTPISAADVAINYINHGKLPTFNPQKTEASANKIKKIAGATQTVYPLGGGLVDEAISLLNGRGVCLESDLSLTGAPVRVPAGDLSHHFSAAIWPELQNRLTQVHENNFAETGSLNFQNALTSLASQKKCTARFSDQHFHTVTFQRPTSESKAEQVEFNRNLNQSLTRFRMIAIDYNSQVLSSAEQAPWAKTDHASVLIGRRFNQEKKRCEYLLRNNEKSCADYSSEFECRRAHNHVWVPRERILRSVSSYTYLQ